MTTATHETFPTATLVMSEQDKHTISLCDQYPCDIKDIFRKYSDALDKSPLTTGEGVGYKRWATRYFNQFIGLCEWHGYDFKSVQWRLMIAHQWGKL